jgi:hypothetical protein
VSFFDDLPPPPEPPPPSPQPVWSGPPEDEIGVSSGIRLASVFEDRIVLAVVDVVGYSTGFELVLWTRFRASERRPGRPLHDPFHGMRFGVQFSDGRKADSAGRGLTLGFGARGEAPQGPLVMGRGGGGGSNGWQQKYWIWPLPPPGPLTFGVQWQAVGLDEARLECDAQPILDAAAGSTKLW